MNSRDTKPPKSSADTEIEIRKDGSTMERFMFVTRRLLEASRAEIREMEKEFKKERRKGRVKIGT
jgi:hypothetical protein